MDITRRNLISGAVVAGAAAVAAPGLSVADEDSETVAGPDWLGPEPDIADADCVAEYSADVVVVGLSDSGSIAVRSAVENGASVIAVEKGSTVTACGSDICVPNGPLQARFERGDACDIDHMVEVHQEECLYHTKSGIVRRFVTEMPEVFEWVLEADPDVYICDSLFAGIPDESVDNYIVPNRYPKADPDYDYLSESIPTFPCTVKMPVLSTLTRCNYNVACEKGEVEGLFGHAARKLIMQDGRCVGCYAEDLTTGDMVKLNAAKGVVLCTGTYLDDKAMLDAFTPTVKENGVPTRSMMFDVNLEPALTGDGHKMGAWAGARLQEHKAVMIHHMGGIMGINGYLQLDLDGRRFMNEDIPGQQLENQIEKLRGRTSWQFFDSAYPEQLKYFPHAHGVRLWVFNEDELPKNYPSNTNWITYADVENAVEGGSLLRADTIEELLAQIEDIDVEVAKASIERYNELCRAGKDVDFGKDARRLFALENPPFYACKWTPALDLVNMDGLESDEYGHTFDVDRNVIPGLYVAGNVQGDRFAFQYPISMPGCSVGMALFYGCVAGKSAALGL